MNALRQYLVVGGAGALGAMLRLSVASVCSRLFGVGFPVGTMVINVSGSLFLGWFLTITGERLVISPAARMAVAVGFVGAYTTFSTYMFETNLLLENRLVVRAMINLFGSLLLGLIAVRAGVWLAR